MFPLYKGNFIHVHLTWQTFDFWSLIYFEPILDIKNPSMFNNPRHRTNMSLTLHNLFFTKISLTNHKCLALWSKSSFSPPITKVAFIILFPLIAIKYYYMVLSCCMYKFNANETINYFGSLTEMKIVGSVTVGLPDLSKKNKNKIK